MSAHRVYRVACVTLLLLAACGGDSTAPTGTSSLALVTPTQPAAVGEALSSAIMVKATDAAGRPASGVTVRWDAHEGSLTAASSETNSSGIAATRWQLGTVAGTQLLTASATGYPSLTISIVALAGPSQSIVVRPASAALDPLDSISFTADVAPDEYGNPITTPVAWSTSDDISAPISEAGVVHASRAGRSKIRATVGLVTGRADVVVSTTWKAVVAGAGHSCALDALGYAFCWGSNGRLQLGVVNDPFDSIPVPVSGGLRFSSLAAGRAHTCGLTADHIAYCWGDNSVGQLGVGSSIDSTSAPTLVSGGISFTSLETQAQHTCGLTASGDIYCWGRNHERELGDGDIGDSLFHTAPVKVSGALTFSSIAVGGQHSCAVSTSAVPYCWGSNYEGQIGDSSGVGYDGAPAKVNGGLHATRIVAGEEHSCALLTNDQLWCWGYDERGQLGDGNATSPLQPSRISTPAPFVVLSAGNYDTCALTSAGQAYCWGSNQNAQDGTGNHFSSIDTPQVVSTDLRFVMVSVGSGHSCALTATGQAYCWGGNSSGEIGDGTSILRLTPVQVSPP